MDVMESQRGLSSDVASRKTLDVLYLALGLLMLLLPLLAASLLFDDGLPEIREFRDGLPATEWYRESAVPNLPPLWMQRIRYGATNFSILAYPLSLWGAARWAGRLRRRGRYALSLFPLALPLLAASPLLAVLAADRYREATAPALIRDVATDGSHAWVTASSDNESNAWLATLDLSSAGEPRERSVVPLRHRRTRLYTEPRRARWNIVGASEKAVVLTDINNGISVLDQGSEENFHLPDRYYDVATAAAGLGHLDLVLEATLDGLLVRDPTTPRSMRILGRVPMDESQAGVEPLAVLAMDDRRALVVSLERELWAFDFDDPAHPRRRGKWVSAGLQGQGSDAEVAAAGPLALVLSNHTHLFVIDFSDPDHPAEVGRLTLTEPVHRLRASGTVAAMATMEEPARVLLVDLSQPRTPTLATDRLIPLGRRFSPSSSSGSTYPAFALAGTRMVLAAGNMVQVFDVSRPSQLSLLGELQLRGR